MNKKKLLALLMALVMTLTLVPVTALATEDPVASVASAVVNSVETNFSSLEEALANADKGTTVKLLSNIDYSETTKDRNAHDRGVEQRVSLNNVTLDLQGHSIKTVNASVVFDGIGTIQNGVFTLNHINAEDKYQAGSYALCIDKPVGSGNTNLALKDLVLEGGLNVWSAVVTVDNVTTETTASQYYAVWAEDEGTVVTINSGTFKDTQTGGKGVLATGTGEEAGAMIIVNGGYFNAANDLVYKSDQNTIQISGGYFTKTPVDYLADDCKVVESDDVNYDYKVTKASYVAQINETGDKYESLQAAIDAAQNGDTVKLLENIEIGAVSGKAVSAFTVRGKDITIDGNNKTITANGDGKGYVFRFYEDSNDDPAQCVLKNLTINSTKYQIDILAGGSKAVNNTLSIDNVHVSTEGEAVYASDSAVITATNSSFAQNGQYKTGLQEPYYAAATVGYAGSLTLTDCEISAVSGSYAAAPFPSGGTINLNNTVVNGDLFAWIGNGPTTTLADSIININSGKVNGNYGYKVSNNGNGHIAQINVNGGVYTNSPASHEGVVIKEGYQVIANTGADSATYPYTVGVPVAEFGGTQYTKLADAIAAANVNGGTVTLLRDYDMEANEPGYGYTSDFLAQGETTPRNNMIEIGDNVTFDLGTHTLSNLFNNVFNVTGDNVVVQNGEMRVGQLYYSDKTGTTIYTSENQKTCSYVMYVSGASDFVVNNLRTYGGINVAGSTATINNLQFSGTKFYAVCSQSGADVTINGGTYNKAIEGATNHMFWVESGSTMNITGGNYVKGATTFLNGNVKPVITGGKFDFDPTNYGVAEGYEAVSISASPYTHQVGIVKATASTEGTIATSPSIEFTVGTAVKESDAANAGTLAERNDLTVTVSGTTEETTAANAPSVAVAALSNIKNDATLQAIVENAVEKASSSIMGNNDEVNVVIQVAKSAPDISTQGKVSFEVHPEAVISVNSVEVGTVRLNNDQIKDTFNFKLNVSSIANPGEYVRIDHVENNAVLDSKTYRVGSDYCVEISGITRFSIFVGEKVDNQNESFAYLGASVRRRVQTSSPRIVVNTCTDMRFGFVVKNYDPYSSYDKYYFQWKKEGGNWSSPVEIINFDHTGGECVASLVITNIPQNFFDTKITAMIYKEGEAGSALTGDEMSVRDVANAIITKYGNGTSQKQWVDYATYLTTQNGSYTVDYDENDKYVIGHTYTAQ